MPEEPSLQGWAPEIDDTLPLARVVDLAFDYRGDVTVDRVDGTTIVGYLFNRDGRANEPYAELMERSTGASVRLPYSAIAAIRFTGRDTAAARSSKQAGR